MSSGRGREAVKVRQCILALLLIGAAFVGGAFVSGPGIRWVQAWVLQSLGTNDGLEIAAVNLESTSGDERTTKQTGSDSKLADQSALPSAPLETKSSPGGLVLAGADLAPSIADPKTGDLRRRASNNERSGSVQLDSLNKVLPSGKSSNEVDQSPRTHDLPRPKLTNAGGDSWARLESKMRALGVTRFKVEGEPNRHIKCTCLIPQPGLQTNSQWVEAEAEDLSQAVRDVLCRTALWRATQKSCAAELSARDR
jgi:hypothetical protein